jgi:hypothetical protein
MLFAYFISCSFRASAAPSFQAERAREHDNILKGGIAMSSLDGAGEGSGEGSGVIALKRAR